MGEGKPILMEERGVECELAVHREAGSLQVEIRRVASRLEQRSAVDGPWKEEMDGGACACPGELDFKRCNGAATGLERRLQEWFSRRCDQERLETSVAGLLEFYRNDVPIERKPWRRRLKLGDRAFAEFLKPSKRLGYGSGRFPAHQEGSGRRKPGRRIWRPRRINRHSDASLLTPRAGANAEGGFRVLPEKHHNVKPRPR